MDKNNLSKEYLEKIVDELCKAGEDRRELSIWVDLHNILSEEERQKLLDNLEKELKDLRNLCRLSVFFQRLGVP